MSQLYWITPLAPRSAEFMLWVRPRGGLRLLRSDLEHVAASVSLGRRRSEVRMRIKGFVDSEKGV